jgi:small conductance mechanosensitive channel
MDSGELFLAWLINNGPTFLLNLLAAILIFFVGRWLAGVASRFAQKALQRSQTSPALIKFFGNLIYWGLFFAAIIAALERLGVQTTTFVAVVGAAGLAIGLALQGALANFASGVMILIFKPYKLGDLVEINGAFGTVDEIQIFNTILLTPENKTVIIPNGLATSDNIVNYSKQGKIRVDMVFGIGYGDDLLQAKALLSEIIISDPRVLPEPAPTVAVSELADSSVNFVVRPFVKTADYWGVYFATHEQVKLRFDAAGISIPYPQQDVHLFPQPESAA